jgi:hypothetical protein
MNIDAVERVSFVPEDKLSIALAHLIGIVREGKPVWQEPA